MRVRWSFLVLSGLAATVVAQAPTAPAKPAAKTPAVAPVAKPKPEYPPFQEVSKDYKPLVAQDGSYYHVWHRKKDHQLLAELPAGFDGKRFLIAMTEPGGNTYAGLQSGDLYVYWKRFGKRLALIQPNVRVKSTGDQGSKDSVSRIFTDSVLLDVEIKCMGPHGQPVIDLDDLLLGNLSTFYGYYGRGSKRSLATLVKAKVFPNNLEIAFQLPAGGRFQEFHWSFCGLQGSTGYKPRVADDRLGYFTTSFRDLGKVRDQDIWQRYITRWHLEKADPKLKLSPPKRPIQFYIEHTVPVRYRRFVKDGVLAWNKAFEKVGILDAIEVAYQDKATGAHMDKDPEDTRYNFVRWLNNDQGTAIGPSRAHPETGEILDADIVLTDGWIRYFWKQAHEVLPQTAMEGMSPATLRWLDRHPAWDPRVRLAPRSGRERALQAARRRAEMADGKDPYANFCGVACTMAGPELRQLAERMPDATHLCLASTAKAQSMAFARMVLATSGLLDEEPKAGDAGEIDGIPEWILGPLLMDLTAHEVGHTLGLRHNFKASSIYTLEQVNSPEWKGKRPIAGSFMDYLPSNIVLDDKGKPKGDLAMICVGPYDEWVIEYGYTFDDPKKVLERCSEPELAFGTDYDSWGADPQTRLYDFAADTLAYAQNVIALVGKSRAQILEKFVKEGDNWGRARDGYELTLDRQLSAVAMMAAYIGGSSVHRDHKGDKNARQPLVAIPATKQRAALQFVIDNSFPDKVYGLTPKLLQHLAAARWEEDGSAWSESTYEVHDRIGGIQASVMTNLLDPTALMRVHDTELAADPAADVLTIAEIMATITDAVWSELDDQQLRNGKFTPRQPAISSLRRNLQREHLERMIELSLLGGTSPAERTVAQLARSTILGIQGKIGLLANADAYTRAHLLDANKRIEKALEASYSYDSSGSSSGGFPFFLFRGK